MPKAKKAKKAIKKTPKKISKKSPTKPKAKKPIKKAVKAAPKKTVAKKVAAKKTASKKTDKFERKLVKHAPKTAPKAKKVEEVKSKAKSTEKTIEKKDKNLVRPSEIVLHKEPIILKSKRKYFTHQIDQKVEIPSLIEIQLNSYNWYLQEGIRDLLEEITPIQDFSGKKLELHFLEHSIGETKYNAETAKNKNLTYEAPLKVHVQLINKETGEIKEQDVFLCAVPLMTIHGTFIVNGIERVVVSQIVRSPGVFFSRNTSAPPYCNAKIIPKRGAWLEIETDKKGIITVKIDRKRKIPITSLLRVFGYENDKDILNLFADVNTNLSMDYILNTLGKDTAKTADEAYQQIYRKIRPGDLATPENAKSLIESMFFDYRKYDMGAVARYKLNRRFVLNTPNTREYHTFQVNDLVHILKYLIQLNNGEQQADDID